MEYGKYNEPENIFSDLLFNILVVIFIILALAILLINPIAKKGDIKKDANFVIQMEWEPTQDCDVDIWVKGPNNEVVFFGKKTTKYMHIERDDMGILTDTFTFSGTGKSVRVKENREIWTLRSEVDGVYIINAHLYSCFRKKYSSKAGDPVTVPVNFEIIRINPRYHREFARKITLNKIWEEQTVVSFRLLNNTEWFQVIDTVFQPLVTLDERNSTHVN